MTARLVVDLSNKSAEVRDTTGRTLLIWSGVTRSSAEPLAASAGWLRNGPWVWTSPPDRFWCPVIEKPLQIGTGQ